MNDNVTSSTSPIHFIPGVPLLMEGCRLAAVQSQPGLYLSWRNLDQKIVEKASITLYCYDTARELLAFSSYQYTDLQKNQGESFGDDILIPCQPDHPNRIEVELQSIQFADDTTWQPEEETWFAITMEQEGPAIRPMHAPEKTQKGQTPVKKNPPAVSKETAKAQPRRRARVLIPCALALLAALICAVIFYVIPERNYQAAQDLLANGQYDAASLAFQALGDYKDAPEMVLGVYYIEAENLLAQGDREGAIAAFAKAGDYTNAAARIDAIQYQQAQALLAQGQEEAAYALFSSIPHYEDAAEQARNIRLDQASRAMMAGDYAAAATLYQGLGENEHPPIYAHAQSLFRQGLYGQAAAAWQFIIDYQDSRYQIYQCAQAASAAQDYALSIQLFTSLADYQDSPARVLADTYALAQMLLNTGENQQALEIFQRLGDYENAPDLALEARYRIASTDLEGGRYAQAKAAFLALSDYKDSPQMALEADYQAACFAQAQGDYPAAIDLFSALADYKDSADQLIQCRYSHAAALLDNQDYDGAIQYFIALHGYENSDDLLLEAYYGKALALSAQGELAAAYDYFLLAQNYLDAPQLALDHAFNYGLQLQALGQYEEALSWYSLAGDHPQIPQQKFLIGEIYFASQAYDQALAILKECTQVEGANEYLYALGQYFESVQLPVRAYAAYVYAGDYQDSADRRLALMETMKTLADQAFRQGQFQEADLMYETLAQGGVVTEESLQAEFFAFLTQPGRKLTLGAYPQAADGTVSPVIWRVLTSTNGYATLLADQPLGCAKYESRNETTVAKTLSNYSSMFTNTEKTAVGNCYLLTQQQLKKYLPTPAERTAIPTPYAKSQAVESGTYRTEGVWTASKSDDFNYVIYDFATGAIGQNSLTFKTNYVRPAAELKLNSSLYQLLSDPLNGYAFYDALGNQIAFQSRYQ